MKANVIVVTGTPGTGKTAFSRLLAKQIEAHYLSLGDYAIKHRLYGSVDRRRKSKIVDLSRARRIIREIISEHQCLIVDTHMPEGIVPCRATKMVFVLRCNPKILERRLRSRHWTSDKITENVMAEMLDSCLIAAMTSYGKRKVAQVDTSNVSVKHTVLLAMKILSHSKHSKLSIDWLGKLENDRVFAKLERR